MNLSFYLTIGGASFDEDDVFGVRRQLRDEQTLQTLITAATEFLGNVPARSTPSGMVLGEVHVAGGGTGPLCGRCRTPQHAECRA